MTLEELGQELAVIRLRQKVGQKELADKAGVSIKTIYNNERGKFMNMETFNKLLDLLGYELTITPKKK